jgi:O-antigen biosynthesis protein
MVDNRVTVAIITRNRSASLKRTLEAVSKLDYPNFEIVVVDNASTDNTKEIIELFNAKYVFSQKSNGFSISRQRAVEVATGEFIAWCDDDCVPEPDWVTAFVSRFVLDPTIGLIGGQVININFPESLAFKGKSVHKQNGRLRFIESAEEADFYGNLNMAVRTSFVKRVGGYDPFYVGGYEEIDLNLCLRKAGYSVVYEGKAIVLHYHNSVSFKKGRIFKGSGIMRLHLFFKHKDILHNRNFVKHELLFLQRELIHAGRGLLSSVRRWDTLKMNVFAIELINVLAMRMFIPWLYFKGKKSNERLLTLLNAKS